MKPSSLPTTGAFARRRSPRPSATTSLSSKSTTPRFAIWRRSWAAGPGRGWCSGRDRLPESRAGAGDCVRLRLLGTRSHAQLRDRRSRDVGEESDQAFAEAVARARARCCSPTPSTRVPRADHRCECAIGLAPEEPAVPSRSGDRGTPDDRSAAVPASESGDVARVTTSALRHRRPGTADAAIHPQGDRYMPSLGVAAALLGGGFKPEEVVLEVTPSRFRDRWCRWCPGGLRRRRTAAAEPQLTTLINYRAPPLVNGERPYKTFEVRTSSRRSATSMRSKPPSRSCDLQGQNRVRRADDVRPDGRLLHAVRRGHGHHARHPAARDDGGQLAIEPLHPPCVRSSPGGQRDCRRPRDRLLAALLPFTPAAWNAARDRRLDVVRAGVVQGGLWLDMTQPLVAMGMALFAGTAYRISSKDARSGV